MSTPDIDSQARPLTRRELRELAEREQAQAQAESAQPAVAETPAPHTPRVEGESQQQRPAPVTRRSMYSAQPVREVPQVIPPTQASAVRTIDETGTLSKLVDPKDFEPSATSQLSRDARAENTARVANLGNTDGGTSRNNLSGYLRQAPPSSQIPQLEEDGMGKWRAGTPASAQTRLERAQEKAHVLPTWDAGSSPFAEFAQQTQTAQQPMSFTPETSFGQSGLPQRAGGDLAAPTRVAVESATQSKPFGALGSNETTTVMPAWDAITSPTSTLPQDPTGAGVFAPIAPATPRPENTTAQPVAAEPAFPAFSAVTDTPVQNAAVAHPPVLAPVEPSPSLGTTGIGVQSTPTPVLGGVGTANTGFQPISQGTLQDELDDDEDFEVDHSYTWLHYIILIAVAFVLGMIIWKVGLDNSSQPPAQDSNAWAITQEILLT